MKAYPSSLRSSLLPTAIAQKEIERVQQPAVRKAIMTEFVGNMGSPSLKVRSQAAQLTAENVASYGMLNVAFAAQMPLILMASWNPLYRVIGRIPAVATDMVRTNQSCNYLAMEAFNAGVRATKG